MFHGSFGSNNLLLKALMVREKRMMCRGGAMRKIAGWLHR